MAKVKFAPRKALIMYTFDKLTYFESCGIERNNKGYHFLEGHPLRPEELSKMAQLAMETTRQAQQVRLGWVPDKLLYVDIPVCNTLAWWIPAGKYRMKFKDMKIKSANCMLPALVFVKRGRDLYLFALKEDKKPQVNTELLCAPLYNVYHNGNVCMGNVVTNRISKLTDLNQQMNEWERAFFTSTFTSHGAVQFDGDILKTYKALEKSKGAFPADKMIPAKKTLKDAIAG